MPSPTSKAWRRWALAAATALFALNCLAQSAPLPADGDVAPLPSPGSVGTLNLDTTSATTDLSINTPTGWWFYTGISAA